MNIPGFLDLKNKMNVVKWMWRVHAQGGCMHFCGRDLQDHRNEEDLKRGRSIQLRVMQTRREQRQGKKVVNLAVLRIQRGLRRKA